MLHNEKIKLMRALLTLIILIFNLQSFTKADDIRDFEIEGMSIGDSLLDYYSLKEIKKSEKNPTYFPKSKKFKIIFFDAKNKGLYRKITFEIKRKDKNYIIYGVKGSKPMSKNNCLKKKDEVVQQIKSVLPNNSSRNYSDNYGNSYGNSIAYIDHFDTSDGGMIRVWCSVWDANNQIVKNNLWKNTINIGISSKELRYFIDNEAY